MWQSVGLVQEEIILTGYTIYRKATKVTQILTL